MMMIHNSWTMAVGNADELRKQADDLDQITKSSVQTYLAKAGDKLDKQALKQLMDDETWLTAKEAVDYGLADEVMEPNKAAASIDKRFVERYKHVPKQLIKQAEAHSKEPDQKQQLTQEKLNEIQKKALANAKALNISINKLKKEF